jgi:hypothetical protein
MNKERELLERILVSGIFDSNLFEDWEQYIKELLAKPEQEPVNFDLERMKLAVESPVSDVTVEGLTDKVKSNRVFYQEGYAQAELDLKQEPLSDEEIILAYRGLVKRAIGRFQKTKPAHGIGVDDE